VVLVAVLAIGYFSFMGSVYYYSVGELLALESPKQEERLKVRGELLSKAPSSGLLYEFEICDVDDPSIILKVVHSGDIPNDFDIGRQLVIDGRYDATEGVFRSKEILTKCSSKYEPAT